MSAQRKPTKVELPVAFEFLFERSRYKAAFGGRGGGKSRAFGRALLLLSLQRPLRILCAREVQKSIADSVKRLLDDDIDRMGLGQFFDSTLTEIRSRIGGLFIFSGLKTNIDAVKSTEGLDIAWVEEANRVSQRSMDILIPTVRKEGSEIWLSWNPETEKDPVDKMFRAGTPPPNSIVRKVTWEDNPWFPAVLAQEMEWDRGRDPEKYAHVWLGEYLKHSEARVFRNWKIESFEVPEGARPYYGADWGFANDPTVLIRCWIVGRTLYVDREAYQIGCEIDKTPALFDKVEGSRRWPITADSARPETISYMRKHGFAHIQSARKGPGSLEDGVEFLKSYDIIVHPDCRHVIDELTLYSYKTDKLTGEVLPILSDKKNHTIDAVRYAVEQIRAFDGGSVYSQPETSVVEDDFAIPKFWPRVYALDIDGQQVSALWGAYDVESDVLHVYAEYSARADLAIAADAIRKKQAWIPGLFDHLGRGRSKPEGQRLIDELIDRHLDLFAVQNDAEAAVAEVRRRLSTKRLRVFATCHEWLKQYRAYRRDKDGDLVSEGDGLMRAMDLLAVSGKDVVASSPQAEQDAKDEWAMASRDSVTGY